MKLLLGHLDWGLGTKEPHSDPADKTFLGLCIVSNVSKWSDNLLKMGYNLLPLAPVLLTTLFSFSLILSFVYVYEMRNSSIKKDEFCH